LKYTPKDIPEGINASREHPLRELGILLGGLIGLIALVYVVLGFVANYYAERMSPEMEKKVAEIMGVPLSQVLWQTNEIDKEIQKIADEMSAHLPRRNYSYQVHLMCNPQINAFAFPGGKIILLRGLVEAVKSKNELAMIIGHEIGHFQHRDHLRGLGRSLVLVVALSFISSVTEGAAGSFVDFTGNFVSQKFSQAQESAADEMGAELLNKTYGQVGGMEDFFVHLMTEPLAKKGTRHPGKIRSWFLSHPHPEVRIEKLQNLAEEKQWRRGPKAPLPKLDLAKACEPIKKKK